MIGWMDGWMDEWMNKWTREQTNGWMNGDINESVRLAYLGYTSDLYLWCRACSAIWGWTAEALEAKDEASVKHHDQTTGELEVQVKWTSFGPYHFPGSALGGEGAGSRVGWKRYLLFQTTIQNKPRHRFLCHWNRIVGSASQTELTGSLSLKSQCSFAPIEGYLKPFLSSTPSH